MGNYYTLAFDYGLKNIGVAVGQSLTKSYSPLSIINAKDGIPDWQIIKNLLDKWQPKYVIVGLPLNMDDSESEMSIRATKFARRLHGRFGCHVELIDERLSSQEAKEIAKSDGHRGAYKDNPIDALAASLILKTWWQQQDI